MFPKEQLLWLRTEDYKAAPAEHIQALIRFLGGRMAYRSWLMTCLLACTSGPAAVVGGD